MQDNWIWVQTTKLNSTESNSTEFNSILLNSTPFYWTQLYSTEFMNWVIGVHSVLGIEGRDPVIQLNSNNWIQVQTTEFNSTQFNSILLSSRCLNLKCLKYILDWACRGWLNKLMCFNNLACCSGLLPVHCNDDDQHNNRWMLSNYCWICPPSLLGNRQHHLTAHLCERMNLIFRSM
jgi:hypothetical protein